MIQRFLVLVGLDIDTAHGIQIGDLNSRLKDLSPWEIKVLTETDPAVQAYVNTVLACEPHHSIIHSLVVGAIRGLRGFIVPPWLRKRLKRNRVELTSRLAKMFIYSVEHVLQQNIYWKGIRNNFTCEKLDHYITDQHERAYVDVILTVFLDVLSRQICWEYIGTLEL